MDIIEIPDTQFQQELSAIKTENCSEVDYQQDMNMQGENNFTKPAFDSEISGNYHNVPALSQVMNFSPFPQKPLSQQLPFQPPQFHQQQIRHVQRQSHVCISILSSLQDKTMSSLSQCYIVTCFNKWYNFWKSEQFYF